MEFVNSRGYQLIGLPLKMDKDLAVIKCKQNITGNEFIIKWINCEESDENDIKQLMREKVICLTLEHQNIVKFVEFFESPAINAINSYFYQVMELCGSDLKDWFKNNKNRSLEMCDKMIDDIISGLSYLHSKDIMHRDLKPQNILIGFDGICKLADFGLVQKHIKTVSKAHTNAIGTELYAAPELRLSEENFSAVSEGAYNLKVDVYSLGIIFVEFYTIFNKINEISNAIQNIRTLGSIPENFFENFDRNTNANYFINVKHLIIKMTKTDPKLRPNLNEVKHYFSNINIKTNEENNSFDNIHLNVYYKRKVMQILSTKNSVFNKIDSELINCSKFIFIYYDQNESETKVTKVSLSNEKERIIYEIKVNEELDTILGEKRIVKNLSNKTIIDIISGYKHVLCLTENNHALAWGDNSSGQLGNGTRIDNNIPTIVRELNYKRIVSISCGEYHALAMSSDGNVYAWGGNRFGQLGIDSNEECIPTPTLIQAFPQNYCKITAISCGASHSLALTENGAVFSWGWNRNGQSGDVRGVDIKSVTGVVLEDYILIKNICCGPHHSLLLTNEGNVYSFGSNVCGQLGRHCDDYNKRIATKIESSVNFIDIYSNREQNISIALSETQKCFVWGKCGEENIRIPRETQFESIIETIIFYSNNIRTPKAIMF